MMKNILLLSIALVIMSYTTSAVDHSGIKFGIDTEIFKLLGQMNLNNFIQNKTLIPEEGITIESKGFFSYKLQISNLSVSDVNKPIVDVTTRSEGEIQYLTVGLKFLEIKLQTAFNIEVIGLFKDQSVKSPVRIVLDSVDSEFYFYDGNVKFTKLVVKIGTIDLEFNNFFFKVIYKIAKGLIISKINSEVSSIHELVEAGLNKFITSQMLFDVGMGIGINATNVDRPVLESFNKTTPKKRFQNFANMVSGSSKLLFLSESNLNNLNDKNQIISNQQSSILKFGIHAALYPNAAPDVQPDIESAVNMEYIRKTFNNDISLLISDYTINTLLFMIQQTGALKYVFANDTNTVLPYNIDTESLGKIIPQISQKYPENKLVEIKLFINALDHKQPLVYTDDDGATFTFNFEAVFNVFNSTDSWDDPVKELQLNLTAHAKLQFLVQDQKMNIICFRTVVDQLEKKFDGLDVTEDEIKKSFDGLLNDVLKAYKPMLSNIDVLGMMAKKLDIALSNLIVLTEQKYIVVSFDLGEF